MEAAGPRRDHYRPACAGGVEIYRLADAPALAAIPACADRGALNAKVPVSDAGWVFFGDWRSLQVAGRDFPAFVRIDKLKYGLDVRTIFEAALFFSALQGLTDVIVPAKFPHKLIPNVNLTF